LFFVLSLVYLVRFAYTSFDVRQLCDWLTLNTAWRLALAALLFAATSIFSVLGWHVLLRRLSQPRALGHVAAAFCVTQIAKYLPGNVGHHVGRVAIARSQMLIPATVSLQSILQESALALLAALLVSAGSIMALPEGSFPALQHDVMPGWQLSLLNSLYVILFVGISSLALVNGGRSRWGRGRSRVLNWLFGAAPSWRAVGQALPAYLAIYVVNGFALAIIAGALMPVDSGDVLVLAGAYSLSWAVGFMLPGAPGGLGVREAALALLLTGSYAPDQIIALSILSRVASVAADMLIFAFGLAMSRRYRGSNTSILATEDSPHD
jgi:uncharacterized membrane protein YbhN (UPF0104 family)